MATVPTPILAPLNDFSMIAPLKAVNGTTGKVEKLVTGTVTFFLAITNLPTATEAHASLTGSAVHVGGGNWLIQFDASVLTAAMLAGLFSPSVPPILIIVQPNGFRVYLPLIYAASKPAILVAS